MFYLIFLLFLSSALSFDIYSVVNKINIPMRDKLNISTIFLENKNTVKPPLLLIHGSDAGAWIYQEYWMDYFFENNISSYSVNMRGSFDTGNLDKNIVNFMDHVDDLEEIIDYFDSNIKKPIVVAHSYGGLVLTKFLENKENRKLIEGAIWLSSIPPSGEKSLRLRFFFRIKVLKVVLELLKGNFDSMVDKHRVIFYDKFTSSFDIIRFKDRLDLDSQIRLNISSISNNLPHKDNFTKDNLWENKDKKLVIGSYNDFIVDPYSIKETAKTVNSRYPIMLKESGHNLMLGTSWDEAAFNIVKYVFECF